MRQYAAEHNIPLYGSLTPSASRVCRRPISSTACTVRAPALNVFFPGVPQVLEELQNNTLPDPLAVQPAPPWKPLPRRRETPPTEQMTMPPRKAATPPQKIPSHRRDNPWPHLLFPCAPPQPSADSGKGGFGRQLADWLAEDGWGNAVSWMTTPRIARANCGILQILPC